MRYIPGIKKNALQPHFYELLECVLLQRWTNLVRMASPSPSSDILSVFLHCTAELQQKPPTPLPQAGELRAKCWSHSNGCTSHIGNETPLSLSEAYTASALSCANHLSVCFSFPDASKGLSELQPNGLRVEKKGKKSSSAHISKVTVIRRRRWEGEIDWEAWS